MSYHQRRVINPPYTVVGHSGLGEPRLNITMKAGGLRAILDECESDEDLVHVTMFSQVTWDLEQVPPQSRKQHFSQFSISAHK